jgi:DNA-binding XRE family transcriptional regulator
MEMNRKSAFLRAARAWLGEEQRAAATAAGVGWNTLLDAEKGRACTDKSWAKLADYYRSRGISLVEDGELVFIIIR